MILFSFWRIDSVGGLAGSMVACLALGVVYEGVKCLRDALYTRRCEEKMEEEEAAAAESAARSRNSRSHRAVQDEEDGGRRKRKASTIGIKTRMMLQALETTIWSRGHLVQTGLHVVQVVLVGAPPPC